MSTNKAPTKSPTVLGYNLRELIGTGGVASVYRALAPSNGNFGAVKIVPLPPPSSAEAKEKNQKIVREMRIHETLDHPNILRLFGGEYKEEEGIWMAGLYLVLELAEGGDLFDKIAPDWGVPEDIAHLYFHQLIEGIKYLAKKGVCHRDIKPENCLLDKGGNLKISDFGLATVFRFNNKTRALTERCGSPPYAAPELAINAPYAAEPIDVWSAGILLFTLMCGNTPWDEPTQQSPEFADYITGALIKKDPWDKISREAMRLLLGILEVDPEKRYTVARIQRSTWYIEPNHLIGVDGQCTDGVRLSARLVESLRRHGHLGSPTAPFEDMMSGMESSSQAGGVNPSQAVFSQYGLNPGASFQSSLRLYSRLSMAPSQRLNPNLTRFFSISPIPLILSSLSNALTSIGINQFRVDSETGDNTWVASVRFSTLDRRSMPLSGRILISPSVLPDMDGGDMDVETSGVKGWDVVLWKKAADPLELKRLWGDVLKACPNGLVYSV